MLTPTRVLLPITAAFVLANAWIHVDEWNTTYADIPDNGSVDGVFMVQEGFLLLAASCVIGAVLLGVAWFRRAILPAAIAFNAAVQAGGLVVLIATRRTSVFGWSEPVWTEAAEQTRAVEIAALVGLGALAALEYRRRSDSSDDEQSDEQERELVGASA